jgi:hypothetical protein
MFDSRVAELLDQVCSAARAESRAAAQRLVGIGEVFALRMRESGETAEWAVDATDAVCAEVAAALGIGRSLAASQLRYARALRERLPRLGQAFVAGDIDEATFRTAVFRTGLIRDDEVLAQVDEQLAAQAPRWGSTNQSQLGARIDKIVLRVDRAAVRRRQRIGRTLRHCSPATDSDPPPF